MHACIQQSSVVVVWQESSSVKTDDERAIVLTCQSYFLHEFCHKKEKKQQITELRDISFKHITLCTWITVWFYSLLREDMHI